MKCFRILPLVALAIPAMSHAFLWTKTITFTDPDGTYTYSGSADFTQVGSTLQVVFTNTAPTAANFQRRILTAVFWDLNGNPSVTKNSATITGGSSQINGGDSPANIGAHWAFKQGLAANQWGNARYGISATGLNVFGPGDTFPPGGGSPQGTDYGLVPAGGTSLSNPYVQNSMTFTMNLPGSYTLSASSISNVWFQYGSATDEFFANVPEPGSMAALAIGAVALLRKRRKK